MHLLDVRDIVEVPSYFDQIVTDGAHRLLQCFYEEQSRNSQVVVCDRENASLRLATY